ncbi:NAD(P)-dependent dehydrogenase, short-chain alcohol dehydrogenase family [Cyclobacterium xiamenense]|uniref:NAD(P)-dependent dehydrogenase, short-chain alcohol dehydrogenase family n=1 Tax=Cyclobacterium xiamenense TaxID=1297121 RepID=A0A1H6ZX08_9BACT|nr:oxidoreductase [Cyclobacterium xiamenense]SEJ58009.1 NAD(P)-dependent dehydrogenase, short-chain alcohol dehydrogenase family [Cyclobacterium xiamenense]
MKWSVENAETQEGKVAIITGANSGLGFETALGLAKLGCEVILACRDMKKAKNAEENIRKVVNEARLKSMSLDLSKLSSIQTFTTEFKAHYQQLDYLVNNAGVMMPPFSLTEDGFERQLAVNYLGHFSLTGNLLPYLINTKNSRIVTLTSLSFKWAEINFKDPHFEKGYSKKSAYGQSKRACLVFAFELQRRLEEHRHAAQSIAAHPGLSNTNLDRYFPSLIRPLGALFLQNVKKGALPILYAVLDDSVKGGDFIGPDGFQEIRGYPTKVEADEYSNNLIIGQRLWDLSERLTKTDYPF